MPSSPEHTADLIRADASLTEPGDVADAFGAGEWAFTPEVAKQFDDHVRASVPYYDDIQALIAELSDWLLPAGSLLADLGCSTGNTAAAILARNPKRGLRVWLYDEQVSMLAKARPRIEELAGKGEGRVNARPGRLGTGPMEHTGASLTVAAFVLQFCSHEARLQILSEARRCSGPAGALLVAEKIRPADARWAEIANDVSHDVKAGKGISAESIRSKARALRGVLVPYTLDATIGLIEQAGWASPEVLFKWHSWALVGAFAGP